MPELSQDEEKIAELRAIVESIKDRVRGQYPSASVAVDSTAPQPIRIPLADLTPILHARDAAQAKMAAIGSVNPRRGGLANSAIQSVKRSIARGLGWFVRDQIVFNRGAIACVEATMEALNDLNRSLATLAGRIDERLQQDRQNVALRLQHIEHSLLQVDGTLRQNAEHTAGLDRQWTEARRVWELREEEQRAAALRISADFERSLANSQRDIYAHTQAHVLALEKSYTDLLQARQADFTQVVQAKHAEFEQLAKAQHADFECALARNTIALQKDLAEDLRQTKLVFERLIHNELHVIRQRGLSAALAAAAPPVAQADFDYQAFSHRFRGSEEQIRTNQRFYIPWFQGLAEVLDIGCGQGEFLDVMKEAGIHARGIDLSPDSVSYCRSKGLDAEEADLFTYLSRLSDHSLDGIFSAQVVEHLPGSRIPEMIRLCSAKLRSGGLLAIETPNPDCLAIFATHFYLDPTHVRPVPHALLAFYLEESGMGGIEVHPRFPAPDSWPELNQLPEGVRNRFFGGLDYAIFARKL